MHRLAGAAWLLAGMLALAPAPAGAAETDVATASIPADVSPLVAYSGRIAGDDARTRLILDFDRRPEISVHYVANPYRILIDLPDTVFALKKDEIAARGLFSDIRYGGMAAGKSRIVLTADRPASVVASEVRKEEGGSYRLVVDTAIVTEDAFSKLISGQTWKDAAAVTETAGGPVLPGAAADDDGSFVIAVDAGHGGIDNGAQGATTGTHEKAVTLAFARELTAALNAGPTTKAVLTRDKDEFLSLSQRVQLARNQGANLLISIHADTLRQKDIRGATVYTISDKASDSLAANLAARENLSDEIAGMPFQDEPAEVADILIDLTRRETQAFSINLANEVVGAFEGEVKLINNPHRHAGFRVLTAPDVPSVLLELGFLSNKDDEQLLLDPAWQKKVAGLIAEAVQRYRSSVMANGG
ncbi:N-acetylmuramoyl-L-alanine amidase [Mycoplana sp. MJR14]|uniref:N-acetylmuramoyl-L-alanine amidase n=1 Tax=Mycoplana sp. MJR14 TaxID=3032583 RepID=UPI0023DBF89E|nr:N-acetylmuramoyl-L-alanine amidase [Mycoplana sp. MJR14]MDF1634863.1 N-acetylmuramoyl-L-alanine amidase [Mycoplana sp. MJR14]